MDSSLTMEISERLSYILDCAGFSPQMIATRKSIYREKENALNFISRQKNLGTVARIVGSKGEGIARVFASDEDILFLEPKIKCLEPLVDIDSFADDTTIFMMKPCKLHPGHFKLLLRKESLSHIFFSILRSCMIPIGSDYWLSSNKFLRFHVDSSHQPSGPALCQGSGLFSSDKVLTFSCKCPSVLQQFLHRSRKYDWPPVEVTKKMSQMNGNLVPKGTTGCQDEELEWRLCFNEYELLLVRSWNDAQTKLYVLLKLIKKNAFKESKDLVSSYILKNIVFWLSESFPQSNFRPDNLYEWVFRALGLLKRTIKKRNLPCYLIFERNLIKERISKHQKEKVIREITCVMQRETQWLFQIEKIFVLTVLTPSSLGVYRAKSDLLEILFLQQFKHLYEGQSLGIPFEVMVHTDYIEDLETQIVCLINTHWPQTIQEVINRCLSLYEKKLFLLS